MEKYKPFAELVECRDASIFMLIPALLVLKGKLRDVEKSTSERFLPGIAEKLSNMTIDPNDETALEEDVLELKKN